MDQEEWIAKLSVLKENIEHHVEEEGDLFVKAKKVRDEEQIKEIGEMMNEFIANRKMKLG